jgi:Ras-related GTP-binding protein A/B
MVLHLWDCGGQETFMENYMAAQRDQIFKNVQVIINIKVVLIQISGLNLRIRCGESRSGQRLSVSIKVAKNLFLFNFRNYQSCLEALVQNSPSSKIFCLVHKMDLIQEESRNKVFEDKKKDITQISEAVSARNRSTLSLECFRSSIWDETLYKAWSAIVYQLIPNISTMEEKLKQLAEILEADEVETCDKQF